MEEEKEKINKKKNNEKTLLHTYMSDMADVVRQNEGSVIKIALAEQKARERGDYYRKNKEKPIKKVFFAIGGIIIILIAVAASYFLIQKEKEKNGPTEIITVVTPVMSYDSQTKIDATNIISKVELIDYLSPEIKLDGTPLSIKEISLTKKIGDQIR